MRIRYTTALTAVLFAACGGGEPMPHRVLDPSAEPLAEQFDADSGKVRAIFLASPT